MSRRAAVLFGALAGLAVGWLAAEGHVRRHREDLFSPRPIRRLAALRHLAGQTGVETVQLLRDYLAWERHPFLRRRAAGMVHRMESVLG